MKQLSPPSRQRPDELAAALRQRLVGQPAAVEKIIPYIHMHGAGLAPGGRPVGNFLLLGPTGTGKTRTVEALAEVLHGSAKSLLRIDCGEFQLEHEVAKLIGAPPGYLGHRETHPMITQHKLSAATSEGSRLSLVLFDEIEKAAPSLGRLLLGVLDKASLHLGDNTTVNFEQSLIFMTSNLGAAGMGRLIRPGFGFQAPGTVPPDDLGSRLERIAMHAVRRRFSPEFVNRIDAVATYQPLGRESLEAILEMQLSEFRALIRERLRERAFEVEIPPASRVHLLERGTSAEFGARELKRALHRDLIQPLAAMVAQGQIPPGATVHVLPDGAGSGLTVWCQEGRRPPAKRAVGLREETIRLSA